LLKQDPDPAMLDLAAELAEIERQGLRRRRRLLESAQGAHIRVEGRDYLSFCSNDYLGLAADPRIAESAAASMRHIGLGAGASHLVSGHFRIHDDVERALARFVGLPRALLFSAGYLANLAVVTVLAGRSSHVFADRLNHASLNDAMILSRAKCKRYAHCDLAALGSLLAGSDATDKIVLTDAVFSMDCANATAPGWWSMTPTGSACSAKTAAAPWRILDSIPRTSLTSAPWARRRACRVLSSPAASNWSNC
jgi:8-amino-7-oxononanoate synthase